MIYANTAAEIENRCKAFIRKWKFKCRAVTNSLKSGPINLLERGLAA